MPGLPRPHTLWATSPLQTGRAQKSGAEAISWECHPPQWPAFLTASLLLLLRLPERPPVTSCPQPKDPQGRKWEGIITIKQCNYSFIHLSDKYFWRACAEPRSVVGTRNTTTSDVGPLPVLRELGVPRGRQLTNTHTDT